MERKHLLRRWTLGALALLLPVAAILIVAWLRWGVLAERAVQIVMKMAVIP